MGFKFLRYRKGVDKVCVVVEKFGKSIGCRAQIAFMFRTTHPKSLRCFGGTLSDFELGKFTLQTLDLRDFAPIVDQLAGNALGLWLLRLHHNASNPPDVLLLDRAQTCFKNLPLA